ncbi:MAG TPA: hypothetical protein VK783_00935 [Bacteroidia bacterium]|nr:hypothetical protein [Bacteroidia bacterium]
MSSRDTVKDLQDIILKNDKVKKRVPQAKKVKTAIAKVTSEKIATETSKLEQIHEGKLLFRGRLNNYFVMGALPMDFSSLKVTLLITEDSSDRTLPDKVDLYEHEQVQQIKEAIARLFCTDEEQVGTDMLQLASLLEKRRDEQVICHKIELEEMGRMSHSEERTAKALLTGHDIMGRMNNLLEKAGIIGQEHIRLMIFMTASSYKSTIPLHMGIKGNAENVNELISKIGEFVPLEDRLLLNNVSARSFYHCSHSDLMNKAMLLPNGLEKKAAQALKLLQQGGVLTTATTTKNKLGNIESSVKQVRSHFSSIAFLPETDAANTGNIKVSLDENHSQTERLIQYHNSKCAGLINDGDEKRAGDLLRHILYCIEPMEVVNPHAGKIIIHARPDTMIVINKIFQALVNHICLLHQYKRKKDEQGRLIAEINDVKMASDLLFNAISVETEDMEPQTKKFFTNLRGYVSQKAGDKAKDYWFSMRELRHEMGVSKTSCFRFTDELFKMEYVERNGYANRGLKYRIVYWDDMEKNQRKMRNSINTQLEKLGVPHIKYHSGTPEYNTGKDSHGGVPSAA